MKLSLRHFVVVCAIGAFAAIGALSSVPHAWSQVAPQLATTRVLDGSVASTGANCTATNASGCAARVGVDKALAVNIEGRRATYRATVTGLVPAASATDIAYINGSATKTVRVTRIVVSGTAGTHVNTPIILVKRSTANSGGTCAAATNVPLDSSNAAATAVVNSCTANPTTGTLVGNISARSYFFGVATEASGPPADFLIGQEGGQPLTLRGVAQGLAVNLGAVSVTSGVVNVTIEWTEE